MSTQSRPHTTFLPRTLLALLAGLAPACETEGYDDIFDITHEGEALDELRSSDFGRRGYIEFGEFSAVPSCKTVSLSSPMPASAGPLRAQVAIDHRNSDQQNRDATTAWVQWVSDTQIKVCVRELSHPLVDPNGDDGLHYDGLGVSYWVYDEDTVSSARRSGRANGLTMIDDTKDCNWIYFDTPFTGATPVVHATLYHPQDLGELGATVWLEKVQLNRFKACARTTAVDTQTGAEFDYAIHYYAYQPSQSGSDSVGGELAETGTWSASDDPEVELDDWIDNKVCVEQSFGESFSETPDVFLTIDHLATGGHDATTAWIENLDTEGVEICFAELADPGDPGSNGPGQGSHLAELRMTWTAVAQPSE